MMDHSQLEQIIVNLAVNARDAMPNGGTLTIETSNAVLDEDYCRRHLGVGAGDYVLLAVSDTGHGMDEDTKAQIFEPLYTTKPEGTGLGLYIVQEIVTAHEGQITVESVEGQGTTFTLILPRVGGEG